MIYEDDTIGDMAMVKFDANDNEIHEIINDTDSNTDAATDAGTK